MFTRLTCLSCNGAREWFNATLITRGNAERKQINVRFITREALSFLALVSSIDRRNGASPFAVRLAAGMGS